MNTTTLTERELIALRRYKAAYCLAALYHEHNLSDREASRWQFARWLVATGRLGADDQAADTSPGAIVVAATYELPF